MVDDASTRLLTVQGRHRRDELLAHAERLFIERGVTATRMVDIAAAAGVAKGLVYWYFETKDALLAAIVLEARERLRAAQARAVEGIDAPLDRLYVGTAVSVRVVDEHWNLYRLVHVELSDPRHAAALEESARVHALDTVAVLEEGHALGVVRDDDPLLLAHGNQGIVTQFVQARRRGHIARVETAAHAAARMVVHAVAASSGDAEAVVARHRPADAAASRLHRT